MELRAAIARKVRVRIVKDPTPLGGSCQVFKPVVSTDSADCQDQKAFLTEVRQAGGSFAAFNKAALCGKFSELANCFQHGKVVVVDGVQVMISTGNFDASNLCDAAEKPSRCNRDYSVVSDDKDVIAAITQIVERDLQGLAYSVEALLTGQVAEKLTVSPFSQAPIVSFIQSARTSLQVQNQYLKAPEMNKAIEEAGRRGVSTQVVVASFCSFGKPSASEMAAVKRTYGAFDAAGIKSKAFNKNVQINGHAGYMHAKAILVDGNRAWVGSVNGSDTSLNHNREFGIFLTDAASIAKLRQQMTADFDNPKEESWQDSLSCGENGL